MLEREKRTAVKIVRDACRLAISIQKATVSPETLIKRDRSPVTAADFGVQALVSMLLQEAFPGDPIVAEEESSELALPGNEALRETVFEAVELVLPGRGPREIVEAVARACSAGGRAGRFWVLDPIDGTKGFLRGDQYAIALALVEDGRCVLGVLGCPNLPADLAHPDGERGSLFVAVSGQGATSWSLSQETEEPIHVADPKNSSDAVLCESYESAHSSHDQAARIALKLGIMRPPVRIDSQCKYAVVARGDAAIYLRLPSKGYSEKIWDHAAGSILVTEAGGRVTDLWGRPLDFGGGQYLPEPGVIATCGKIHDSVVEAVGKGG